MMAKEPTRVSRAVDHLTELGGGQAPALRIPSACRAAGCPLPRLIDNPSLVVIVVAALVCASCTRSREEDAGPKAPMRHESGLRGTFPADPAGDRHLLLTVGFAEDGVRVIDSRIVPFPLPRRRGPPRAEPWRVEVETEEGRSLYAIGLPAANVLRGEFSRDDGTLEGVHERVRSGAFPVRLPLAGGAARVRFLAAAASLGPEDARVRASPEQETIELGRLPWRWSQP